MNRADPFSLFALVRLSLTVLLLAVCSPSLVFCAMSADGAVAVQPPESLLVPTAAVAPPPSGEADPAVSDEGDSAVSGEADQAESESVAPLDSETPAESETPVHHAYLLPLPAKLNPWEEPEPGFEYARFPAISAHERPMDLMVVRVDPTKFDFVIRSATSPGERPRTLQDWAAKHNLAATINAGMYLPDGLTNTGYLRVGDHANNARVVKSFGAFLLTDPKEPRLPQVRLVDRSDGDWELLLSRYRNVVQNYRMVSSNRRLLWRPSVQEHAISALGTDGSGRILLIHSREPVTGVDFATMALALPLDLRTLMYLEGGIQAGLYVRPGGPQLRMGRHPADFWTDGSVNQLLPNIIGVKAKGRS